VGEMTCARISRLAFVNDEYEHNFFQVVAEQIGPECRRSWRIVWGRWRRGGELFAGRRERSSGRCGL